MRCTVSQNRVDNHWHASCRAAGTLATKAALAGCFALVLAVPGCGGNRPPTFGELTGQPPAAEVEEAARPVREQERTMRRTPSRRNRRNRRRWRS